jgi:hypothetical protein
MHIIGSGTGLAGLVAGAVCASMMLTDYNQWVVDNLLRNINLNRHGDLMELRNQYSCGAPDGEREGLDKNFNVERLDWAVPLKSHHVGAYNFILMVETLYEESGMEMLSTTVTALANRTGEREAVCLVVSQLEREGVNSFKVEMARRGWELRMVKKLHSLNDAKACSGKQEFVGYVLLTFVLKTH